MKKLLCVLLVICCLPIVALAESIDLSSLSFEELRVLQTRISIELASRPEWKEVAVPEGFYKIGEDIPAGKWEIRCGKATKYKFINIEYGKNVNESGAALSYPLAWSGLLYIDGQGEKQESIVLDLKEGYYIEISYGQAIFQIPEKVDLGF